MKTLKFKSNIKCGGCIEKVAPVLNGDSRILKWEVDTSSSDRILDVTTETLSAQDIVNLVSKAGFLAEPIN
jgi:copper chaperone